MKSIAVTPFALRNRSAWMQNGHVAVVYIVIVGAVILDGRFSHHFPHHFSHHFSIGSPASFHAR